MDVCTKVVERESERQRKKGQRRYCLVKATKYMYEHVAQQGLGYFEVEKHYSRRDERGTV